MLDDPHPPLTAIQGGNYQKWPTIKPGTNFPRHTLCDSSLQELNCLFDWEVRGKVVTCCIADRSLQTISSRRRLGNVSSWLHLSFTIISRVTKINKLCLGAMINDLLCNDNYDIGSYTLESSRFLSDKETTLRIVRPKYQNIITTTSIDRIGFWIIYNNNMSDHEPRSSLKESHFY